MCWEGWHYTILQAVIAVAKQLEWHTVAEGIETQDSDDILAEQPCDSGQGYFYSKPIPVEEVGKNI